MKKVVERVLKKEKKEGDLSVVFIKPKSIQNLNKKFLGKNRVTDILVFGQSPEFKFPEELGEVVICPKQVKKNAKRFSTEFEKELTKVLIHGILHLVGYNHKKSKEIKKMEKKENFYLGLIK
ncbi:hypothetical protein AMJ49_00890 [Parcubacteria bacterium DG_74_2]|nr:MAG: hypothetical protein AMJ49_00890 [Parcubacteria bacterium DG_74_2]